MELLKITKDIASKASEVYAVSWKTAYKNIVPQKYLDELSLEWWTPLLLDSSRAGYVLKDDDDFIAAASIAPAREEKMNGWGEIISIYVLPKYFNQGYGKNCLNLLLIRLVKTALIIFIYGCWKKINKQEDFMNVMGFLQMATRVPLRRCV